MRLQSRLDLFSKKCERRLIDYRQQGLLLCPQVSFLNYSLETLCNFIDAKK